MSNYKYKVQGIDYNVDIVEVEGNVAKVTVNGVPFEVEMEVPANGVPTLRKVEAPKPAPVPQAQQAPKPAAAPAAGAAAKVCSPLPGTITSVAIKVGDSVKAGDTVVVLEAMKMQNNIEAENDGVVASVEVNVGDSVPEGAVLVTIA